MSVTWTPVDLTEVRIRLLTEAGLRLLTEDGVEILVTRHGQLWSEESVPADIWTPVTATGSWTKING